MSQRMKMALKKAQAKVGIMAALPSIFPGSYQRTDERAPSTKATLIRNVRMPLCGEEIN